MKLYGLTGGIASGKSAVTKILRKEGYAVLDLDQIARDVVQPGSVGLAQVIDTFGAGYLNLDGTLDRKKLANLVFHDRRQLDRLDAVMGPLMWGEVKRQKAELKGDIAFLDAALLIEKGMTSRVDGIILVTAPMTLRIRRAMERDGATEEHVRARMAAQMSDDEKRPYADFVIENSSTLEDLHHQVDTVLRTLHESF